MKFTLLDRIVRFESPRRICAIKGLSLSEEYLVDHFPNNPVMPGVLMLEAMVQAGSWLLRVTKDFSFSLCLLQEATNVKYARFLVPGDQLFLEVDLLASDDRAGHFMGQGKIEGKTVVSARWTIQFFNLAQEDARLERNDRLIITAAKEKFGLLGGEKCWRQMVASAS